MFDVIVVGARVAGSPTAMLLARQGHRVLLLDRVLDSGPPPHKYFRMDFGPFAIVGPPPPVDGAVHPYCVRRTVLDKILVDAAGEAGAEVRERFTVEGLVVEDGTVTGVRGGTLPGWTSPSGPGSWSARTGCVRLWLGRWARPRTTRCQP